MYIFRKTVLTDVLYASSLDDEECSEEYTEGEETEGSDYEDEDEECEDDEEAPSSMGARPRRMSEIKVKTKIKPIPLFSSLFMFSPTNK